MASTFEIGHRYEKLISDLIAAGVYNNKSEVVRDALRQLERTQLRWDDLKRLSDEALADPRPAIPAEHVFAELRQRFAGGVTDEAPNQRTRKSRPA